MRTAGLAVVGLLMGFVVGIVLSDLLVVELDNVDAARGLPLYLAAAGAVAAPLLDRLRKG